MRSAHVHASSRSDLQTSLNMPDCNKLIANLNLLLDFMDGLLLDSKYHGRQTALSSTAVFVLDSKTSSQKV